MFSMEKKVFLVYDMYQNLFILQQHQKSISEYYSTFWGLIDELT